MYGNNLLCEIKYRYISFPMKNTLLLLSSLLLSCKASAQIELVKDIGTTVDIESSEPGKNTSWQQLFEVLE